jgi:hypothetical protein
VARTIASKRDGAGEKPPAAGADGSEAARQPPTAAAGSGGAHGPQPTTGAPGALAARVEVTPGSTAPASVADGAASTAPAASAPTERPGELRPPVDLGRLAWLLTVITLLAGMAVLGLKGDYGYAATALAVALAAAINLF